jgi:hypothetical protein
VSSESGPRANDHTGYWEIDAMTQVKALAGVALFTVIGPTTGSNLNKGDRSSGKRSMLAIYLY